jgi:hypothetical protein
VGQIKKDGEGIKLSEGRTRIDIGGLMVSSSKSSAGFGAFVLKTIGAVWWFGFQNHRWPIY